MPLAQHSVVGSVMLMKTIDNNSFTSPKLAQGGLPDSKRRRSPRHNVLLQTDKTRTERPLDLFHSQLPNEARHCCKVKWFWD